MGRSGKSEWDEAMLKTGHRVVSNTKKKWASRLRSTTKNANVVDSITREQVRMERVCECRYWMSDWKHWNVTMRRRRMWMKPSCMRRQRVFVWMKWLRDRRRVCMEDGRRNCWRVVWVFFPCSSLRRLYLQMYLWEGDWMNRGIRRRRWEVRVMWVCRAKRVCILLVSSVAFVDILFALGVCSVRNVKEWESLSLCELWFIVLQCKL